MKPEVRSVRLPTSLIDGTPMPWGAYARMTEDDMRRMFRYLRTLPPFEHATGPAMQDE